MKIVHLVPGSGGSFYCGNCMRDSVYVNALRNLGNDVVMIRKAGSFSIDNLSDAKKRNEYENIQSSLLAIAEYYIFMDNLVRSNENEELGELLKSIGMNILKKYNEEDSK